MSARDDVAPGDSPVSDGRYDAFVVWCDERDNDVIAFDIVITAGAHKGDALAVLAPRRVLRGRDPLDAIGLPCTLVVERGAPAIEW